MVIWPNSFGESDCFISFEFNVELVALEGEQCSIPAFPLLEVSSVVTVIQAHFTPQTLALRSQTLLGCDSVKPVTGRPAQFKAAGQFFD